MTRNLDRQFFASGGNDARLWFDEETSYHLIKVLRVSINDRFTAVLNSHKFNVIVISISPLEVEIISCQINYIKKTSITLLMSAIKPSLLEYTLKHGTELGINNFVIYKSSRTKIEYFLNSKQKINRYNKIIKYSAEQSKRYKIPKLILIDSIFKFKNFLGDLNYLADTQITNLNKFKSELINYSTQLINSKKNFSISLIVGPEGGFEATEINATNLLGYKSVQISKQILRSETVGLYLASIISFLL